MRVRGQLSTYSLMWISPLRDGREAEKGLSLFELEAETDLSLLN